MCECVRACVCVGMCGHNTRAIRMSENMKSTANHSEIKLPEAASHCHQAPQRRRQSPPQPAGPLGALSLKETGHIEARLQWSEHSDFQPFICYIESMVQEILCGFSSITCFQSSTSV